MGEREQIEQPLKVIGRYALYGKLAAGGMATVHLGRLMGPAGFSRTVAIKRLHPQFAKDPEFVAMFLDEARLAARIQHPNVVATVDVVARDEELFLVMDYVRGESFSRLLRASRKKRIPVEPKVVVSIISGMLHGLHAAHEAKDEHGRPLSIVHRDVSPQNVIVGADGVPRVLDFGVAKAAARVQITRDGQMKGKLCYMSPEQLRGAGVDRRSDVFAAGIVLWEALTGRRLFDAEEAGQVLDMILQHPVPAPSSLAPGVPKVLDLMCERALARDPEERYQSARELAVDLEEAVVLAPPREVGEWVEAVAGPLLSAREEMVAEIESHSAVSEVSSASDSAPALMRALDERMARQPAVSSEQAAAQWDEAPTSVIDPSAVQGQGLDLSTRVQVPRPSARPLAAAARPPIRPDDFDNEETTVYDPTLEDYVTEATPASQPGTPDVSQRASAARHAASEPEPSASSPPSLRSGSSRAAGVRPLHEAPDAQGSPGRSTPVAPAPEESAAPYFTESDAPPRSDRERAQDAVARRIVMRPRMESIATSPAFSAPTDKKRRLLLQGGAVAAGAVFLGVFFLGRLQDSRVDGASTEAPPPSNAARPAVAPQSLEPASPADPAAEAHTVADDPPVTEDLERDEPPTPVDPEAPVPVEPEPVLPPRATPTASPVRLRATRAPSPEPTPPAEQAPSAEPPAPAPARAAPDIELDLSNPYAGAAAMAPSPKSAPAKPKPAASATPPARAPKPADCSTPYVVDEQGIRRIRPECL